MTTNIVQTHSQTPTIEQAAQPLVHARGIHKSFKAGRSQVEILHGIDLSLHAGETLAIMGPSGSGKSTLLACLAGLEQPSGGTVNLLGRDLAGQSRADLARARRSDVGFIFQSYNILPALTGSENVALPFRLRGERPPAERIASVMEALGISHLANSRPASMSGGEQQRVAIARVLTQSPTVLFADEPTGALDSASGERALELLIAQAHTGPGSATTGTAASAGELGSGLLLVTHDPGVAARCDRVVVMRDGLIVEELRSATVEQVTEGLTAQQRVPDSMVAAS